MHLTHTITPSREAEEDPEYGFCEETKADVMHLSLEKLQLLACELRGCGTHPQAIERVCDYVVHDPCTPTPRDRSSGLRWSSCVVAPVRLRRMDPAKPGMRPGEGSVVR